MKLYFQNVGFHSGKNPINNSLNLEEGMLYLMQVKILLPVL